MAAGRKRRRAAAPRGAGIAPFYAMEVMKAANERQASGADVLHMEIGEPGGGPPPCVIEAAAAALRTGRVIGYTEALGIAPLRARIARHYAEAYGLDLDPGRVVVTTGSSAGFVLALLASFAGNASIGLAEPGYPAYRNIVAALGMRPAGVATGPETRFQPTPELLDRAGPLDGIVIASPANPTGTMVDVAGLAAIADWAAARGVRVISDEVYHGVTYGAPAGTFAALAEDAFVVHSFSKYFAMTGWRLGWMIVPPDLVRSVERLAQNLYISPPALSQYAALAAFDDPAFLDAKVAGYARSRALLLEALPASGFDRLAPADGAFYAFADVSALTNDSGEFCRRMLEETGVAATPGIDFDPHRGASFVRFAFAGAGADIKEAARRLAAWTTGRPEASAAAD